MLAVELYEGLECIYKYWIDLHEILSRNLMSLEDES